MLGLGCYKNHELQYYNYTHIIFYRDVSLASKSLTLNSNQLSYPIPSKDVNLIQA